MTPALDALGRGGAVFLDATAHAPLTLPSHTSILTGRYPAAHGVHDNAGFTLPDTMPTLATVLHGAGFHTAAFVSSYVLRGSTGLARGFDHYDDRFAGVGQAHLLTTSLERTGPEVAREAAKWLAAAPRPYFFWVHFYDPARAVRAAAGLCREVPRPPLRRRSGHERLRDRDAPRRVAVRPAGGHGDRRDRRSRGKPR